MAMNLATLKRGGMLAAKKRYLLIALALVVPTVNYLTGDIDLVGLVTAYAHALVGLD